MNPRPEDLAEDEAEPERIICRPQRSNWGVAVFFFLLGLSFYALLLVVPPRHEPVPRRSLAEDIAIMSIIAVPMMLAAAWLALWIQRAAIVADGEKIMWRGLGRARGARWEDVTDFYFVRVKSSTKYSVQTPEGHLFFDGSWTNTAELADFIPCHALSARSREWEPREARSDVPWPRVFDYASFENRWVLPLMPLLGLVYPFVMLMGKGAKGPGVVQSVGEIRALYGWPMAALLVLTSTLMLAAMPTLIFTLSFRTARDARARRGERIEATPEGITWTDGSRSLASTWDEVQVLRVQRLPGLARHPIFHVETTHGNFSFSGHISRSALLKSTVQSHAINAEPATWDLKIREADERPVEHVSEHGAVKVFHYRNSLNRALLWFVALFPALPILGTLVSNWSRSFEEGFTPQPLPWLPTLLGSALFAWLWWRMRHAAILLSDEGIAQATWRGVRFVPWSSIHKYFHTPETYWLSVLGTDAQGQAQTLRFWISIGSLEELRDEIQRRALNSSNRTWLDRAPQPKD